MFSGMRRPGMMGSGNFGVNARDLPLSKDQYYELLELLIIFIMLPSIGFEKTRS